MQKKLFFLIFLICYNHSHTIFSAAATAAAEPSSATSPPELSLIYFNVGQGHCEVASLIGADTVLLLDCGANKTKNLAQVTFGRYSPLHAQAGGSSASVMDAASATLLAKDSQIKARDDISPAFLGMKHKKVFVTHLNTDHYNLIMYFLEPIIDNIVRGALPEHRMEFIIGDARNEVEASRTFIGKIRMLKEKFKSHFLITVDEHPRPGPRGEGVFLLAANTCENTKEIDCKGDNANGNSLVVKVEGNQGCSAMFTGDATTVTMAYMLLFSESEYPRELLKTPLLLISHHGSEFISKVGLLVPPARMEEMTVPERERTIFKEWIRATEGRALFVSPGGSPGHHGHPTCSTLTLYNETLNDSLINLAQEVTCFNGRVEQQPRLTYKALFSTLDLGTIFVETGGGKFTIQNERGTSPPGPYSCEPTADELMTYVADYDPT